MTSKVRKVVLSMAILGISVNTYSNEIVLVDDVEIRDYQEALENEIQQEINNNIKQDVVEENEIDQGTEEIDDEIKQETEDKIDRKESEEMDDFLEYVEDQEKEIIEIDKNQILEQVKEDYTEKEVIVIEEYVTSNVSQNKLENNLLVPLYEAIGKGETYLDISYLQYDRERMLDAFYTAIYRLKTIDEILTINRYSYGDIDIDEGTQLIIGTEIDTITLFYDGHIKITYNDKESICSRYNKIQEAISGLMEEIGQAKNEFEKEFLIHEYVVDTVSFSEKDDSTQSVYSALTKQDVTSEYGYACTQKYLLNKVGIECEIVHLTYGGAALNIVKIDGKYYYVNVWGNRGCRYESGGGSHKYFNLTTAQVKAYGYHFNEEEYPEANDEKYSSILGDVFNGMYYNNSLHYLKIMNTESMSGGYAIVRYDMDKESEKILVDSTKHYINSFTINKETQCVEYVTSTGKVCEVSIYGEIPEATKEFVEMIYRKSIKRQATESEILFWSGELYNETKTVAQLVIELMNHQEFQQRKLSDREYVECLYDVLFDKKDNENLEYWVEQLQKGSTRTYVLAKLCEMSEFIELCNSYGLEAGRIELERNIDKYNTITQFIYRFYGTCMDRVPDEGGIIYWVDELSKGTKSVQEVVYFFVHSEEIENKNLSNRDYLQILYRSFFDREPDEAGVNFWLTSLEDRTYTKDEVLAHFVYSKEFDEICGQYQLKLS